MLKTESSNAPELSTSSEVLRVCIQGYAGAFHEIAARFCFDQQKIEVVPAHTFESLIEQLERGETADIGLMAIENTLAGSLMHNYKLLQSSSLHIVDEVYLRIKQNLMVLPGQTMSDLTEVHSHPVAIQQCRKFFRDYPHIRLVQIEDTALAARNIQEKGLKHVGAIASALAADIYGMEMLATGIETNKKNHTRFLVLQKRAKVNEDADKVSLSFSVDHEVGSLYKLLAVLAAYNINLTKIQSAPIIGRPWEYRFFVDFVSAGTMRIEQAIDAIRPLAHNLKVMGIYPSGKHHDY
ncbi:MAG: prephenate dehydratase [Saprospiraceae bacterium]